MRLALRSFTRRMGALNQDFMKPPLPHPEDPKEFALWLDKQDAIADAQIAAKQ
jgi:hypothetical protein